ncbi:hypothetical protein ABPG72_017994 [Tetrahymena utriculariae]
MSKISRLEQPQLNQNQQRNIVQVSSLDEILTCHCCLQLIRDPHQPPCGHSFCKFCISYQDRCPTCLTIIPLNKNQEKQISRNYMLKKLLENTKLYKCLSSDCGWSTYQQKINQQHLNTCKYIQQKMVIIDEENNLNDKKFHSNNNQRFQKMSQNISDTIPSQQTEEMYYSTPYQLPQKPLQYQQFQDQFGRSQGENHFFFLNNCCCCKQDNQNPFQYYNNNLF